MSGEIKLKDTEVGLRLCLGNVPNFEAKKVSAKMDKLMDQCISVDTSSLYRFIAINIRILYLVAEPSPWRPVIVKVLTRKDVF